MLIISNTTKLQRHYIKVYQNKIESRQKKKKKKILLLKIKNRKEGKKNE